MIIATLTTTDPADRLATSAAPATTRSGATGDGPEEHPLVADVHRLLQGVDPRDLRRVPANGTWYVVGPRTARPEVALASTMPA